MTEKERQDYLKWMQTNLPAVTEWTEWQGKTGELPPDFDQLSKSNLLPDPLRFADGRPVGYGDAEWNARRNEIKQLFEKYVTGTFPSKPAIDKIVLLDEIKGEGYTLRNVRLEFGPQGKGSVRVRVVIPDGMGNRKFPVVISPSLSGWGQLVLKRGYIHVGYAGNDSMDDGAPLKDLYPDYDFATLPRRAWLAQIVVDYLATLPQVDMARIAINGYSRDGKMVLIAAALEERIAAVLAGSTGVGGAVPWRFAGERGGGEGIESTTRMFPGWFISRLRYFSGKEDYLPVDANLLLALVAPRSILLEWGYTDQVANGWAMEQAYKSVQKVYERLRQSDKIGMLSISGFHGSNDEEASIDWLDGQFGCSEKKWVNRFVFPWNFDVWRSYSVETIDLTQYPEQNIATPLAASQAEWAKKKPDLLKSVQWMLGDSPLILAPVLGDVPFMRSRMSAVRPSPGASEIGKGNIGNPGQLAPDVPAWVISNGGTSYSWTSPEKELVTSRRIRFGSAGTRSGGVTGDLYYPVNTPEGMKLPVVIWLHGFHYPLGYMWVYRSDLHPVLALAKAGYAVLAYDQSGFGTRWDEAEHFYDRYPHYSRLGKMVDDLRSAVDVLQNDSIADPSKIFVYGYTMGGTLGLYAAALDDRIGGVVSIAGFTPMRTDTPEKGTSGMTRYSHLYGLTPRLGLFAGNEMQLPYDYDELMALISPRPVLIVQPKRDRDASIPDVQAAVKRAQKIYIFDKAGNKLVLQEPDDYARLTNATQDRIIDWVKENF
ncbi:MAG: alpha/beta fold hydrolase [Tannerella sp.]|nr:alpha/beta fold hydrolase [Tannerella sp.]